MVAGKWLAGGAALAAACLTGADAFAVSHPFPAALAFPPVCGGAALAGSSAPAPRGREAPATRRGPVPRARRRASSAVPRRAMHIQCCCGGARRGRRAWLNGARMVACRAMRLLAASRCRHRSASVLRLHAPARTYEIAPSEPARVYLPSPPALPRLCMVPAGARRRQEQQAWARPRLVAFAEALPSLVRFVSRAALSMRTHALLACSFAVRGG